MARGSRMLCWKQENILKSREKVYHTKHYKLSYITKRNLLLISEIEYTMILEQPPHDHTIHNHLPTNLLSTYH